MPRKMVNCFDFTKFLNAERRMRRFANKHMRPRALTAHTHTHARVRDQFEYNAPRLIPIPNAVSNRKYKSAPAERLWSTECLTPNTVFTNRIWNP